MKLTGAAIEDIAGELKIGMVCHIHRETGKVTSLPDPDQLWVEMDELWQPDIDEVETHPSDYLKINRMDSRRSFQVMEAFADELPAGAFQDRLWETIRRPKPFRYFKHEVEGSDYREQWFAFRKQEMVAWVRRQLEE